MKDAGEVLACCADIGTAVVTKVEVRQWFLPKRSQIEHAILKQFCDS